MYRTSLILKKFKNSSKIEQIKKLKKKLTHYDLNIISLNNIINAINKRKKLK